MGSKLDEILWTVYEAGAKSMEDGGGNDQEVNEARHRMQALFDELIGEDEVRPLSGPQRNGTAQAVRRAHNQIRVELRKKIGDL